MRKVLLFLLMIILGTAAPLYATDKITVEIACFPALDEVYKKLAPKFLRDHPNMTIQVVAKGFGTHHNDLMNDIADPQRAVPDLAVVEAGYIGQFIAMNGLVDLNQPEYSAADYRDSIFPYKWAQGTSDEGKLIGFPYDAAVGCSYWRRDFFAKAGVKIEEIKTMDDLFIAAGKLTQDTDGDGKIDRWFTSRASDIAEMILRSGPSPIVSYDAQGQCVVNAERIREALTWAQKFKQAGYTAEIEAWTQEWYKAFENGLVAYEISGSWLGGHLRNWMAPNTYGKWGVAKWPALHAGEAAMAGGWGGSFLVIPERAAHKAEAWELIKFICLDAKNQVDGYIWADVMPVYIPAWKDRIFDESLSFYKGQKARRIWEEIAHAIPETVSHKYDPIAGKVIGKALDAVIVEGKDPDAALNEIKPKIDEEIKTKK